MEPKRDTEAWTKVLAIFIFAGLLATLAVGLSLGIGLTLTQTIGWGLVGFVFGLLSGLSNWNKI